jgi:hypothetical protein
MRGQPLPARRLTSPGPGDAPARCWTRDEQEAFWFTNQGSQILSYDIFLNLEQASSEELFRSAVKVESFGYIPQPAGGGRNPCGLPIGFTRDLDPVTGREWLGFTCAACHTNVVTHEGRSFLVDGAPTLADMTGFLEALVGAMQANQEGEKFVRLATRVLGQDAEPKARGRLLERLREDTAALVARQARNRSDVAYGNGRLDAFGQIFNEVTAHRLGVFTNVRQPDAPVSYPFLWATPQSDRVQWNGVADNTPPFGALERNVGEVPGAFGELQIVPGDRLGGYPSSVRLTELAKLENQLERLWRPSWQDAGLPALDPALVARGEDVYREQGCGDCHKVLTDPTDAARSKPR